MRECRQWNCWLQKWKFCAGINALVVVYAIVTTWYVIILCLDGSFPSVYVEGLYQMFKITFSFYLDFLFFCVCLQVLPSCSCCKWKGYKAALNATGWNLKRLSTCRLQLLLCVLLSVYINCLVFVLLCSIVSSDASRKFKLIFVLGRTGWIAMDALSV